MKDEVFLPFPSLGVIFSPLGYGNNTVGGLVELCYVTVARKAYRVR